ncbi:MULTISPECIES: hypothetical protein [unclassified Ruegeria]|uniref:hypothetical protein n=1 Tax=unclassified Ruegeria TaxID=2625375 RepID=UPI001ADC59CE|nr:MULTISPECIES: hypothetical protein [unclassified Ruegeria]MBO9411761.1 hypothetical protein [Ruegeria sp. R8_1]MBO9415678.1 hypothetical protein [Ruegeria sp. R8_2]
MKTEIDGAASKGRFVRVLSVHAACSERRSLSDRPLAQIAAKVPGKPKMHYAARRAKVGCVASLCQIAADLNARGGKWHAITVRNIKIAKTVLKRLQLRKMLYQVIHHVRQVCFAYASCFSSSIMTI